MAAHTDSDDFQHWLHKQIKEANLTPAELAEFKEWLSKKSEQEEVEQQPSTNITVKDVVELVAWAKSRMSETFLKHDERREFATWLADRVKAAGLSDDEVRTIADDLS